MCVHAHPDDEAILTAGVMARAAAEGHKVVLVVATRGEEGEPTPGVLDPGESLADRRSAEVRHAAELIGAHEVEFLGYHDSGMDGDAANENPDCFWQADVETAAAELADILRRHEATAITVYDDHGGYGHPDHIQVHRVGYRAAELAGVATVYEAAPNRDLVAAMMEQAADLFEQEADAVELDTATFGEPEAVMTHRVDVSAHAAVKRAALRAHASQVSEDSFFLQLPDDVFQVAFGTEWFIDRSRPRADGAPFLTDLFDAEATS